MLNTKFTKGKFTAIGYMDRDTEREGYVTDHFGIWKSPHGRHIWAVVHLPSKLTVSLLSRDQLKDAKQAIRNVAFLDWSGHDGDEIMSKAIEDGHYDPKDNWRIFLHNAANQGA